MLGESLFSCFYMWLQYLQVPIVQIKRGVYLTYAISYIPSIGQTNVQY